MLLFFSRPIEFLGIFAFFFILVGFAIVFVVSGLLLLIAFLSKNEAASKVESIKSWLAGFAVLGAVFLIANLILAIPVIIILLSVQTLVIEPAFNSSDRTFHRIDRFVTFSGIFINLICYFLAVKKYHRKIYARFFDRSIK